MAQNTGCCEVQWNDSTATVTRLTTSLDDFEFIRLATSVSKLGIDVPLGWPTPFVDAVVMHSRDGCWPEEYSHSEVETYRYRQTDFWARKILKSPPLLSVSTDRISIPTMRAAAVLSRLPNRVARDGSGVVVEVYPAGALRQWGFQPNRYKGRKNLEGRLELVGQFLEETDGWLQIDVASRDLCLADDNAFDALISALIARAASTNLVEPIPVGQYDVAIQEGWIALPTPASLHQLAKSHA